MTTYHTYDCDNLPCPHDCELAGADRASWKQRIEQMNTKHFECEQASRGQQPLTTIQVANILENKGYTVSIFENLVHVSLKPWLVIISEVAYALDFDDTVRVWESPWGVSVLCMEKVE